MESNIPAAPRGAHAPAAQPSSLEEAALRRYIDERFAAVDERFEAGSLRMEAIEGKVDRNTTLTEGIHEFLVGANAGLKVLGWLGEALKWCLRVAVPAMALLRLFHGSDDVNHAPPK